MNLKQIQSYLLQHLKKDVLRNIILVSSLTFITSLLGFFKEAVVASNYGLSLELDTFFVRNYRIRLIFRLFISQQKFRILWYGKKAILYNSTFNFVLGHSFNSWCIIICE